MRRALGRPPNCPDPPAVLPIEIAETPLTLEGDRELVAPQFNAATMDIGGTEKKLWLAGGRLASTRRRDWARPSRRGAGARRS